MPAKTMAFMRSDTVLLAVHAKTPPDDEDWEAYVQFCKKLPSNCRKTVVLTRGGGPNSKQRRRLQTEFLNSVEMKVAVVTDATMVRGIVTALGWFNPLIRAFAAHEANHNSGVWEAMDYLGVDRPSAERIVRELVRMQMTVTGGPKDDDDDALGSPPCVGAS